MTSSGWSDNSFADFQQITRRQSSYGGFEGLPPFSAQILDASDPQLKIMADKVHDSNDSVNWCMFGLVEDGGVSTLKLVLVKSGTGGVNELRSVLPEDQVVYCLCQVEIGHRIKRTKVVLIAWKGDGVGSMMNSRMLLKPQISTKFQPIHFDYTPSSRQSLTMAHLQQLLQVYTDTDEIVIRVCRTLVSGEGSDLSVATESPQLVYVDRELLCSDLKAQLVADGLITHSESSTTRVLMLKEQHKLDEQRFGYPTARVHVLDDNDATTLTGAGVVNGTQLFVDVSGEVSRVERVKLDTHHLPVAALRVQEIFSILERTSSASSSLVLHSPIQSHVPVAPPVVTGTQRAVTPKRFVVGPPPSPAPSSQERSPPPLRLLTTESQMPHDGGHDENEDHESIDVDNICILEYSVGVGRSAVVHHGLWMTAEVAVKIFRYRRLSAKIKDEFRKEVSTLRQIPPHENVVIFLGASFNPQRLAIVCEWLPRGSLHDILVDVTITIDEQSVLRMALDIAKGMQHLHENNVIHRDLKSHNLLVDEMWTVKVADFGLARWLSGDEHAFSECGTSGWVAPEVLDPPPTGYGCEVDVFSYGVVLWEIVSRSSSNPLTGQPTMKYYRMVKEQHMPEIPSDTHVGITKLIHECWRFEPQARPTFAQIVDRLNGFILDTS